MIVCSDTVRPSAAMLARRNRRWCLPRRPYRECAAGEYALKHNVAASHNTAWLTDQLRAPGIELVSQQSNVLFVQVPPHQVAVLQEWMRSGEVLIREGPVTRMVTHLDISRSGSATSGGTGRHSCSNNGLRRRYCATPYFASRAYAIASVSASATPR